MTRGAAAAVAAGRKRRGPRTLSKATGVPSTATFGTGGAASTTLTLAGATGLSAAGGFGAGGTAISVGLNLIGAAGLGPSAAFGTTGGATTPVQLTDGVGTTNGSPLSWYTPPLQAVSITAANVATWSMWVQEGPDASSTSSLAVMVQRVDGSGTPISTILAPSSSQGVGEVATTAGLVTSLPVAPAAATLAAGDRLRVTLWRANAGDQGGVGTMSPTGWVKAWYGAGSGQGRASIAFAGLTLAAYTPPASRFPGDPGAGKVLLGGHTYTGTAGISNGMDWLDSNTGVKHVVSRNYASAGISRSAVTADIAAGRLPFPGFKLSTYTPGQVAAGNADSIIVSDAQFCAGLGVPVWCCYYHEPEDNFPVTGTAGSTAADYRAAFRHIVTLYRSNGATNVAWMPVWQCNWTFSSGGVSSHGGPWFNWDPDWKGTISGTGGHPNASDWYAGAQRVIDLQGYDVYNPYIGASVYRPITSDMDTTLPVMDADGRPRLPWVFPEWGTHDTTPTTTRAQWTSYFQSVVDYAEANDGVGFCYYVVNEDAFNAQGDPTGDRFYGYQQMLTDPGFVTTRPGL